KVVRLVKLIHNHNNKFSDLIMRFEIIIKLQLNKVIKFILFIFILVHISSCLWIYVGKINESPNTWLIHSGLNDMDNFDVYISSLYFITYTILSIGHGDIVSQNYYER